MGELDRITRTFGCHEPSMTLPLSMSRSRNFKLTHYPITLHNTCYRKLTAPPPSRSHTNEQRSVPTSEIPPKPFPLFARSAVLAV